MIDHKDTDCRRWRELLAVLPPDKLSPSTQRALDAHLRSCSDCPSVREHYHLLSAACQDLPGEELPQGLPPRLLQLWQEEAVRKEANHAKKRSVRTLWGSRIKAHPVRALFVGIAAAALVVVLTLVPSLSPDSSRLPNGGSGTFSSMGIKYLPPSSVVFSPSHSYTQALRIVTNLGLHPSLVCGIVQTTPGVLPQILWQPVGQKDAFLRNHRLFVWPTTSAPDDWNIRLNAMSGIRVGAPERDTCNAVVYGTPLPGTALPMNAMQAGAYARVTFASSVTYDAALYSISNQGLALGDFCYEHERYVLHQNPAWHPMSQEKSFLNTYSLVVETTTGVTSTLWQQQLSATPGVITITSSYSTNCS